MAEAATQQLAGQRGHTSDGECPKCKETKAVKNERTDVLYVPCREILGRGQKPVKVIDR